MFERFTCQARNVLALANREAKRFNHEYIATEHILLGLVEEGSGVETNILRNLGIDPCKVRLEVEKLVKSGPETVMMGRLPQTSQVKKVIESAIEEARDLGYNYVGTEHLLLGLLREKNGIAAQVLMNFGVDMEAVREKIIGRAVEKKEVLGGQFVLLVLTGILSMPDNEFPISEYSPCKLRMATLAAAMKVSPEELERVDLVNLAEKFVNWGVKGLVKSEPAPLTR